MASEHFRRMEEEIARVVDSCRGSCTYFPFCGGGAPANKHFENGTFASTETLFCRLHKQACLDVTLELLEEDSPRRAGRSALPRRRPLMILQPGAHFTIASHFALTADWSRRLRIGAGVEEVDGCFLPRGPWRAPTTDELAVLVREPAALTREQAGNSVSLFRLPAHLLTAWWEVLGQAAGGEHVPDFETFVSRLAEFLTFKELPLPEGRPLRRGRQPGRVRFRIPRIQGWPPHRPEVQPDLGRLLGAAGREALAAVVGRREPGRRSNVGGPDELAL